MDGGMDRGDPSYHSRGSGPIKDEISQYKCIGHWQPFKCRAVFDEICYFGLSASVDNKLLLDAWVAELLGDVLGVQN